MDTTAVASEFADCRFGHYTSENVVEFRSEFCACSQAHLASCESCTHPQKANKVMKYQCQSCGQKSNQVNSQGGCIACDSFNMKRIGNSLAQAKEKESKTKIEMAIMLVLWALLIYGVWEKYLKLWLV